MTISGTVVGVIFANADNGYTVIDFDADGKLITAVGVFHMVKEGEMLTLTGEYKNNPKFGEQFVVTEISFDAPTDKDGLVNYLASGLFKGVGVATAILIVNHFGLNVLNILATNPEKIEQVKGIGKKRAAEIIESYRLNSSMRDSIIFLQKLNLSMSLALKIYNNYEEETIKLVKENPYRLVRDIDGVGFGTADKVADSLGIDKDSDFRIIAGVTHTLQEAAGKNGHTFLPQEMLIQECAKLVNLEDLDKITAVLPRMIILDHIRKFEIKVAEGENINAIALSQNYALENGIAAKLVKLAHNANTLNIDINDALDAYQRINKVELHSAQRQAVEYGVTKGAVVITGGPGTGKTTIIKCILELLSARNLKVALCAPTGRASKRMSEATGIDAKTIHRLLGMEFLQGKPNFTFNEKTPLDADVVIVDEISMADIYIFNALLCALQAGTTLILVGDKDQLPSVSAGSILSDIISSQVFPTVFLTEIYRQASDSLIVTNAHRINNCEMPILDNKSSDFFVDHKEDTNDILASVISMVSSRIPKHFGVKSQDIQVLAPMKKGVAGVEALNIGLQKALNPYGKEIIYNNVIFRVGDKVMHTVNNYSIKWQRFVGYIEEGEGVFNGDLGYILDIKDKQVIVEFEDGKRVTYEYSGLEELMHAYAISVHKSQGSEFPVVIIAISGGSYMMLTKNLLYTAVTRARKMVVIIGDKKNIAKIVTNTFTAKRFTLLREFIIDNTAKMSKLWVK